MSVLADVATLTINLEAGCTRGDGCREFAEREHDGMKALTRGCSVLPLPETFDEYLAAVRTARKRAWRSARLGYRFAEIDRQQHIDDIFMINTSAEERQGRPMTPWYRERPTFSDLPAYGCDRHRVSQYGVLEGETLVAYLIVKRAGELITISTLLGHADHLAGDVMFLLVIEALRDQLERYGPGVAFYHLHDGGTDGLRFFKERLGFGPASVSWRLL